MFKSRDVTDFPLQQLESELKSEQLLLAMWSLILRAHAEEEERGGLLLIFKLLQTQKQKSQSTLQHLQPPKKKILIQVTPASSILRDHCTVSGCG